MGKNMREKAKGKITKRKIGKAAQCLALCGVCLLPVTFAYAGDINGNEQALVSYMNGIFNSNGVDYVATDAAKAKATAYLMQDGVDLSADQVQRAITKASANIELGIAEGYLVPVSTPQESPAETSAAAPTTAGAAAESTNGTEQKEDGNSAGDNNGSGDADAGKTENNNSVGGTAATAGNTTSPAGTGGTGNNGNAGVSRTANNLGGNDLDAEPEGETDPETGMAGNGSSGSGDDESFLTTEEGETDTVTGGEEERESLSEPYMEEESLPVEEAKGEEASLGKGLNMGMIALAAAVVVVAGGAGALVIHRRKLKK